MTEPRYAFGPYVLDRGSSLLRRDGDVVSIGHRGYALLDALLEADGKVVSKDELLQRAWPGLVVDEVNLTVQIASLRKALGTGPDGLPWISTVPRVGYQLPRHPAESDSLLRRPALAVLPFANLSSNEEQGYFADGVVEGLITGLSRFRSFAVVSRSSSFVYRDRPVDVREVSRELGVRYVLMGSVQRQDRQIRVGVQLIEAESGTHMWAERFDGQLESLFAFQDEITETVVGLIAPEIRKAEIERARRKHARNLDAYDLYLRALRHFYATSPEGIPEMQELAERAVALEPNFAPSLALAALAYERRWILSLEPIKPADRERCLNYARAAVRAGEDDPLVLAIAGYLILQIGGDPVAGLPLIRKAHKANPNNAEALLFIGICSIVAGELEVAEASYRRAMQLSPGSPENYQAVAGIGFVYFDREDYHTALDWLLQSIEGGANEWPPTYWFLASAYAYLGRESEAAAAVARLRAVAPRSSLSTIAAFTRWEASARGRRILEGLRRAGLPKT